MKRRDFIALVSGVVAGAIGTPFGVQAQQDRRRPAHVGIVDNTPAWDPFRQQLRELGYVEGENIVFDYQKADGVPDRLEAAATALAKMPVDVIVVFGTPAALAAKRATATVPIVAVSIGDPIGSGLVSGFARPGGNITGNTILGPDVVTKRLQIIKDALPSASRIALLWNPDNASNAAILEQLRQAVPLFHMALVSLPARTVDDFKQVYAQLAAAPPDALLATNDPLHHDHMAEVIDFLLKHRIAGMFQIRQNVVDGGLMSYGANFADLFRQGARYVDKILRGTKPQDLPFEQPTKFDLTVNLKTAKALGITFSAGFLALADEVIQ
jgi:putative ABC transport system substrate-binding protein